MQQFDPQTGQGTGILFNDPDAGAVRWALGQMRLLYGDRRAWARMVANGMAQDFGWDTAVDGYLDVYAQAASRRR